MSRAVRAEWPDHRIECDQRVVVDNRPPEPNVVVVRGDGDVCPAPRRIAARDDADDISRQAAPQRRVARVDVRNDLEVSAILAGRLYAELLDLLGDVIAGLFTPVRPRRTPHH